MSKEPTIPSIKHNNLDLVDLYDKTWSWINKSWCVSPKNSKLPQCYIDYEGDDFDYFYSILPSFFLAYSGERYDATAMLDYFYDKQEENGAIRAHYNRETGEPVPQKRANKEDISVPLFATAELAIYNKTGNKKRLKDVVVKIKSFYEWLLTVCKSKDNGLLKTSSEVSILGNIDRKNASYLVEFNSAVAIDLLKLFDIGDILNDTAIKMFAKPQSDIILCNVRDKMWNAEDGYLYDLDSDLNQIKNPHIGGVFYLLSKEVNHVTMGIVKKLKESGEFDTYNIFPTVPRHSEQFEASTNGFRGGVSSILTYFAIKGLENKGEFIFASECTLRHIFTMLESMNIPMDDMVQGDVWELYKNEDDGPVMFLDKKGKPTGLPRRRFLPAVGLISITLLIENVIGMDISLPQKTVLWKMENYNEMGIENFPLKRNSISIQCIKNIRGWEIRLESEKLYYFKMEILSQNKVHSLPIPSGRCSLLPEKF